MALPITLRSLAKINGSASLARQVCLKYKPALLTNHSACFSQISTPKQTSKILSVDLSNKFIQQRFSHGDHSMLWTVEKGLSASLLAVIPSAFLFPSPILDNLLVVAIVLHQHWGIEAMVIDYVRPVIFGRFIPKVSLLLVYVFSALTLGGLLYFNYNDVGVTALIKRIWAMTEEKEEPEETAEGDEVVQGKPAAKK